ncbi:MAG TPA: peptidylprolyl isomerase [Solirubrobacterales bacterium]|nr:peptidylprolyl isomerase [Solirubrobacterales bacterium]
MPRKTPPRLLASLALAALATFLLAACGGEDGEETTSGSLPAGCQEAQVPPPKRVDLKPPRERVQAGESLVAAVETSCGTFEISLDTKGSPKTVSSFVHLAREGLYDDTTFHRIVPGFVIQGGDPLGTGRGGPGYSVIEAPPNNTVYTKGTVAMVKTAFDPPGRSGSQFYVVTAADAGLPPAYALLGEVSAGQEVVDRISELGDPASGDDGTPLATVVIRTIAVSKG